MKEVSGALWIGFWAHLPFTSLPRLVIKLQKTSSDPEERASPYPHTHFSHVVNSKGFCGVQGPKFDLMTQRLACCVSLEKLPNLPGL